MDESEKNIKQITENIFFSSGNFTKSDLVPYLITHIITFSNECPYKNDFKYFIIEKEDDPNTDILRNFKFFYDYIETSIESGGRILFESNEEEKSIQIILIAAYLIKKYQINIENSLQKCETQESDLNENYVSFLYQFYAEFNRKNEYTYHCILCRKKIFDDTNIDVKHEFTPKTNYSYKRYKKSFVNTNQCSSYFLNRLDGLDPSTQFDFKINCQTKNCKNKLGDFLPKGSQCSCGSWVVPAIQITKSKVDKIKIKNI